MGCFETDNEAEYSYILESIKQNPNYNFRELRRADYKLIKHHFSEALSAEEDVLFPDNSPVRDLIEFKLYKYAYAIKEKHSDWLPFDTSFDFDCCDEMMYLWKTYLERKGCKNVKTEGRTITFTYQEKNTIKVETDTINSLEATCNCFFRWIKIPCEGKDMSPLGKPASNVFYTSGKTLYEDILWPERYRGTANEANRLMWQICNLHKLYSFLLDESNHDSYRNNQLEHLMLLNRWAKLAATWGNTMLGPEGFNYKKKNAHSKCVICGLYGNYEKNVSEAIDLYFKDAGELNNLEKYLSLLYVGDYFENYEEWQKNPIIHLQPVIIGAEALQDKNELSAVDLQGKHLAMRLEKRDASFAFERARIDGICRLIEERNKKLSRDMQEIGGHTQQ